MREAAPQAAEGTYSGEIERALRLLGLLYGERFAFGFDPARGGFWVIEDGKIGSLLTAPTPEALGGLLDSDAGTAR